MNNINQDCKWQWQPSCWVGGRGIVPISCMGPSRGERHAAVKTNAAILRAMRK